MDDSYAGSSALDKWLVMEMAHPHPVEFRFDYYEVA